jgi:hypothetical protein
MVFFRNLTSQFFTSHIFLAKRRPGEHWMVRKLSDGIHRVSNGWVALSALVVFLLFTGLVLPAQASRTQAEAGAVSSPDMSFYYSSAELYGMAEAYGAEGRAAYIEARFTFDLIWPLVYTLFLSTAVSWITQKAFSRDSLWQRANLLPVLGASFDCLENISTSLVMARYPQPTLVLDSLATVFTMVKWVFVVGSFVLLVLALFAGLLVWARARS